MKKWVFVLAVLVVVAVVGGMYLFIPSRAHVSRILGSKCSVVAADRYFEDTSKWVEWWPRTEGQPMRSGATFFYQDYAYTIKNIYYGRVTLIIRHPGDSLYDANMRIIQASGDSLLAGVECGIFTGNNPIRRLQAYQFGKRTGDNLGGILAAFKSFVEEEKNIYGINIEHTMSDDSILITLSGSTAEYPTTTYVYSLIDSVRRYVDGQGAAVHNPPLLNVARAANGGYRTMVALSVNKRLDGRGGIAAKRFVPWKMIEGDVHGGPHTADEAIHQLFKFRDDYHLDIMSIPFEFLITDRRLEPDTTKWVTRVCAPIS